MIKRIENKAYRCGRAIGSRILSGFPGRWRTALSALFLTAAAFPAAGARTDSLSVSDQKLLALKLPPVSEVIDAARERAPRRQYYLAKEGEERSMLKLTSREWTKYIYFDANYKYGMMGMFSNSTQQINGEIFSTQAQHWFQVGVSLHFPLEEFINRGQRLKWQRFRIEQARMEEQRMTEEVTTSVIEQYNKALMHLEVMKIKAEQLELNNVQYRISESNFVRGKIDIAELSRLKQLQVNAKIDYEMTKSEFKSALMMLEMLSGLTLIKE